MTNPIVQMLDDFANRKVHVLVKPKTPTADTEKYLRNLAGTRCQNLTSDEREVLLSACETMSAYWSSKMIDELKRHTPRGRGTCRGCITSS